MTTREECIKHNFVAPFTKLKRQNVKLKYLEDINQLVIKGLAE